MNHRPNYSGIEEVKTAVLKRIQADALVHTIHFVPIGDMKIEVYVFYETEDALKEYEESGVSEALLSLITNELEKICRGPRQGVEIQFELDSHENVIANYEGSYYLRLH